MSRREIGEISLANLPRNIPRYHRDGLIMEKPTVVYSRAKVALRNEAKRKRRHTGIGKQRGTANACLPMKAIWMRRTRVFRRLLRKMRDAKEINNHIYHTLYMLAKGKHF